MLVYHEKASHIFVSRYLKRPISMSGFWNNVKFITLFSETAMF